MLFANSDDLVVRRNIHTGSMQSVVNTSLAERSFCRALLPVDSAARVTSLCVRFVPVALTGGLAGGPDYLADECPGVALDPSLLDGINDRALGVRAARIACTMTEVWTPSMTPIS